MRERMRRCPSVRATCSNTRRKKVPDGSAARSTLSQPSSSIRRWAAMASAMMASISPYWRAAFFRARAKKG